MTKRIFLAPCSICGVKHKNEEDAAPCLKKAAAKTPTTSVKLELVTQADAATEDKLALHKKNIRVYANGIHRSGAQLFGYTYLAGREMNQAKELIPHGQFERWIAQTFPDIARKTAQNWRGFAEAIESKRATVALLPTVGTGKLLSPGGKTKLTKKDEESILKIVPQVMDGKGMMEFLRANKFLADAKPDGGFRPNPEKVQAWLEKNHPDLVGKTYAELPVKVQRDCRRALLAEPRGDDAVDKKEAATFLVEQRTQFLRAWAADEENLKLVSSSKLRELEEARLELGRIIQSILKNR